MRTLFRILLRQLAGYRPAVKVIIVGVGRLAARIGRQIQLNEFIRCRVVGYIQLPGEEIYVSNAPVLQLNELEAIESLNADDVLVAISLDQYSCLRRCISKLEILCKPIRIIVNSGNGLKARNRIIELRPVQMLDLDPSPESSVAYFMVKREFYRSCFCQRRPGGVRRPHAGHRNWD